MKFVLCSWLKNTAQLRRRMKSCQRQTRIFDSARCWGAKSRALTDYTIRYLKKEEYYKLYLIKTLHIIVLLGLHTFPPSLECIWFQLIIDQKIITNSSKKCNKFPISSTLRSAGKDFDLLAAVYLNTNSPEGSSDLPKMTTFRFKSQKLFYQLKKNAYSVQNKPSNE